MSVETDCLATSEGALVSVSIAVEPRNLESLLEALALLDFPVNPGIFHDAAIVTRFPDGREEAQATTLVEFPAYSGRVDEVQAALEQHGFDASCMDVTSMLDELLEAAHLPATDSGCVQYRVRRYHQP